MQQNVNKWFCNFVIALVHTDAEMLLFCSKNMKKVCIIILKMLFQFCNVMYVFVDLMKEYVHVSILI